MKYTSTDTVTPIPTPISISMGTPSRIHCCCYSSRTPISAPFSRESKPVVNHCCYCYTYPNISPHIQGNTIKKNTAATAALTTTSVPISKGTPSRNALLLLMHSPQHQSPYPREHHQEMHYCYCCTHHNISPPVQGNTIKICTTATAALTTTSVPLSKGTPSRYALLLLLHSPQHQSPYPREHYQEMHYCYCCTHHNISPPVQGNSIKKCTTATDALTTTSVPLSKGTPSNNTLPLLLHSPQHQCPCPRELHQEMHYCYCCSHHNISPYVQGNSIKKCTTATAALTTTSVPLSKGTPSRNALLLLLHSPQHQSPCPREHHQEMHYCYCCTHHNISAPVQGNTIKICTTATAALTTTSVPLSKGTPSRYALLLLLHSPQHQSPCPRELHQEMHYCYCCSHHNISPHVQGNTIKICTTATAALTTTSVPLSKGTPSRNALLLLLQSPQHQPPCPREHYQEMHYCYCCTHHNISAPVQGNSIKKCTTATAALTTTSVPLSKGTPSRNALLLLLQSPQHQSLCPRELHQEMHYCYCCTHHNISAPVQGNSIKKCTTATAALTTTSVPLSKGTPSRNALLLLLHSPQHQCPCPREHHQDMHYCYCCTHHNISPPVQGNTIKICTTATAALTTTSVPLSKGTPSRNALLLLLQSPQHQPPCPRELHQEMHYCYCCTHHNISPHIQGNTIKKCTTATAALTTTSVPLSKGTLSRNALLLLMQSPQHQSPCPRELYQEMHYCYCCTHHNISPHVQGNSIKKCTTATAAVTTTSVPRSKGTPSRNALLLLLQSPQHQSPCPREHHQEMHYCY